jgi:hypothetical protein
MSVGPSRRRGYRRPNGLATTKPTTFPDGENHVGRRVNESRKVCTTAQATSFLAPSRFVLLCWIGRTLFPRSKRSEKSNNGPHQSHMRACEMPGFSCLPERNSYARTSPPACPPREINRDRGFRVLVAPVSGQVAFYSFTC